MKIVDKKIRVGICIGDPAGVGPEIIKEALVSNKLEEIDVVYTVLGDLDVDITPGVSSLDSARISYNALDKAVLGVKSGEFDAIVTAPVCKAMLSRLNFNFPGQTEFFARSFNVDNYSMIMSGDNLSVGLVTIHEPISSVPGLLTSELIIRTGRNLVNFINLKKRFGDQSDENLKKKFSIKIAVCGLNPHAGENGNIGTEEREIIDPAIEHLNNFYSDYSEVFEEVLFSKPLPADTLFRDVLSGKYDAALCMYHDQALIPLKLLDFDNAVNVTMGLPFFRTSPCHGTGFDIAQQGIASANSMVSAINMAVELSRYRLFINNKLF